MYKWFRIYRCIKFFIEGYTRGKGITTYIIFLTWFKSKSYERRGPDPGTPHGSSTGIMAVYFACHKQKEKILSIGHYRSFPSTATILFMLDIQKRFIELWTDQKTKSSSNYERIKNKQMTVLLCNKKASKRYTLIL